MLILDIVESYGWLKNHMNELDGIANIEAIVQKLEAFHKVIHDPKMIQLFQMCGYADRYNEDEFGVIHYPPEPHCSLECEGKPEANVWGKQRIWTGDPQRIADWSRASRGESVFVGGGERKVNNK